MYSFVFSNVFITAISNPNTLHTEKTQDLES